MDIHGHVFIWREGQLTIYTQKRPKTQADAIFMEGKKNKLAWKSENLRYFTLIKFKHKQSFLRRINLMK